MTGTPFDALLGAAVTPPTSMEGLREHLEALSGLQRRIAGLSDLAAEGASDDDRVTVEVTNVGVRAVRVSAVHTTRPDAARLDGDLKDALRRAHASLGDKIKDYLGSAFGVVPPVFESGDPGGAVSGSSAQTDDALQKLRREFPEVGALLDEQAAADPPQDRVLESDSGLVRLTVSGGGDLLSCEVDTVGLREADEITLGEAILECLQRAASGSPVPGFADVQAQFATGMEQANAEMEAAMRPLRDLGLV